MIAALVALAAEAAAVGVLAGMLLAWGLAGGDGDDAHPVAALLGLALLVGTVATTVVVVGLFDGWTGAVALATALAVAAAAMVWLSRQPTERNRRPLYWGLAGAALLIPVVTGLLGSAHAAAPRQLLVATAAPAALVLALAPPWGDAAARRDPVTLWALLVLASPVALLSLTLVA